MALVPAGAEALVGAGHPVLVETGAGMGSGFTDSDYTAVGAKIAPDAATVWKNSDMIMKVKEPIEKEWPHMRQGQLIFTYFHFAADEKLTQAHLKSGATCVAYETVELPSRELPLLTPMSEVAGRMAVQEGAKYLEKLYGGRGVLLGGVPGVAPAKVVIIGGGIVGINAAKMAAGLGAKVTILDLSLERLRYLSDVMPANCVMIYSNRHNILEQIKTADLVVGGCANSWRQGAEAHSQGRSQDDAAGRRDRRRGDRSGRLRGDDSRDDARESDLCSRWYHPLRRGEHARWSSANVDAGAHERDASVRAATGQQGLEGGAPGESGFAQGSEHDRRQGDVSGCRRGLWSEV